MSLSSILSSTQITSLVQSAETQYQAPVTTIQNEVTPIQTQISAYGNIASVLGQLQTALSAFDNVASLSQYSATATDSSVISSATADNTSFPASYAITVSGLANAQSLYTSSYSSQSGAIGTGTISIAVGTGTAMNVQITSGNDSLEGIAGAINAANAGVTATIVNNGTGYQLVVNGNQTGSAYAFAMSGSTSALSGLTYSGSTNNMTESQSATNASAILNGITLTSSTNTFSGAVQGVSFSVAATGTSTLTVAESGGSSLVTDVQGFVQAFNAASQAMQNATAYMPPTGSAVSGASSGTAGPLIGSPIINEIQQQMLSLVSSDTAIGSGGMANAISLSGVGVGLTTSGTITLNLGQLQSALSSNYAQVAGLFGAMAGSTNPSIQMTSAPSGLAAGVYAVNVTENSSTLTSGTVAGAAASGVNGSMTATDGPMYGATFAVAQGVTTSGTLYFNPGLATSMTNLLNGVLGSNGSIAQAQQNDQAQITQLNQMASIYTQIGQQAIQSLVSEYSTYETQASQDSSTSSQLNAIFSSLFSSSSSSGG